MIEIKLGVMAVCAALFWLGGYCWLPARRFIMPVIISGTCLLITHDVWVIGMLSCIGVFCLGYGDKSPLRHIFGNGWGRGIWGLLAAICLSLPLFVTHHIGIVSQYQVLAFLFHPVSIFFLYCSLNFTLENALKNTPQSIGDPIIGLGLSSIILLSTQ